MENEHEIYYFPQATFLHPNSIIKFHYYNKWAVILLIICLCIFYAVLDFFELKNTSLIKYLTTLRIGTCKIVHTDNPDVGIEKVQYAYSYFQ